MTPVFFLLKMLMIELLIQLLYRHGKTSAKGSKSRCGMRSTAPTWMLLHRASNWVSMKSKVRRLRLMCGVHGKDSAQDWEESPLWFNITPIYGKPAPQSEAAAPNPLRRGLASGMRWKQLSGRWCWLRWLGALWSGRVTDGWSPTLSNASRWACSELAKPRYRRRPVCTSANSSSTGSCLWWCWGWRQILMLLFM